MTSTAKVRATPLQLRRTGYLVAAIAAFVAIYAIFCEIDYASFSKSASRVDARIIKIDVIRNGNRMRHVLHYELDRGGKTYIFTDRGGKDTKLEELYTGSFNAFTADDPPLAVGKTIGLLVAPQDANDHRPDRDKLPDPEFLWIRTLLALVFLSGVAGFLLWSGKEPEPAPRVTQSSWPPRTRNSKVSSSRNDDVLRVRAEVDVPWPGNSSASDAALRERMRALKGEHGDSRPPEKKLTPVGTRIDRAKTVELSLELCPFEDAQLAEARVDFIGASDERATEAIARAEPLTARTTKKLAATLTVPSGATRLRIALVLADQSRWEHELPL